jgi:hypothetical protein
MKKSLGLTAISAALLLAGCSHPQPVYYAPPPPALNYQAIAQQGFRDGFDAARHDVATGHPPVFDHNARWRRPPVPPPGFDAYRRGFTDGYNRYLHPTPPPPAY